MKQFFRFLREWSFPKKKDLAAAIHTYSGTYRLAFFAAVAGAVILGVALLLNVSNHFAVQVPIVGGNITEGVIGVPRFINPVLAVSDTDHDLTALVYSGLMKRDTDGNLIPNLAESYTLSDDKLTYTFILKNNLTFHDGSRVTTDDIVYTVNQIQNPQINSPERSSWAGIVVKKIDDRTVSFTLPQPYGSFLDTATIGILPSALWKETTPETFSFLARNTEPVGSGPFKLNSLEKKRNGIPTSYTLGRFKHYALGAPYLKTISFNLYDSQDELASTLRGGAVQNAAGLSAQVVDGLPTKGKTIDDATLPRVFGMFLNSSHKSFFGNKQIVTLIDEAIDKDTLLTEIFGTHATRIDGPVPFEPVISATPAPQTRSVDQIQNDFTKLGWTKNASGILEHKGDRTPLYFSLTTADTPELVKVATAIRDRLEPYGIVVELKIFDLGALNQNVIQSRNFDALLFGHVIENEADLYAFWHSSQRNYPGLNITGYANARADGILQNLLAAEDPTVIKKNLADFDAQVRSDHPAIFIYLPHLLYVTNSSLHGVDLSWLRTPSDRFLGVTSWYTETEPVWKPFIKK